MKILCHMQMLAYLRSLKPHELPDPAEASAEIPLSDLSVISYTKADLEKHKKMQPHQYPN